MQPSISPREQVRLLREAGISFSQIADTLGVNENTARGWASKDNFVHTRPADSPLRSKTPTFDDIEVPGMEQEPLEEAIHLPDSNALLISDLHIPLHSSLMVRRAIWIAKTHFPSVRRVIDLGDTWNFDSLSTYTKTGPQEDLDDVMSLSGRVMRSIAEHFDQYVVVNGNHSERLAKKLDKAFDLKWLVAAAFERDWPKAEVLVSNLDYCYLDGDIPWIVGHPSSYSGQAGKTPSDYADLYGRNCVAAHNHITGMAQSKSGRYLGVDLGHMTNASDHYYVRRRMNKHSRWVGGFCIISDGYPYTFSELSTDWRQWGCD